MGNKVELLKNDIIYVKKVGDQTEGSLTDLFKKITKIAKKLRDEGKPVLILSDATEEGVMDVEAKVAGAAIGKQLDYDKSATYGASEFLRLERDYMVAITDLNQKVANFATKEEALDWLSK